jgi:cytosine/adenosine deaminase-related metal-dependent hydrolase
MTILRARTVVPVSHPPIDDGAVVVEGDSIVAVGKAEEIRKSHTGDVRDLGDVVLSPGLINAHCHLDYSRFHDEVKWRGSFIEWILQLLAVKQLRSDKEYAASIRWGVDHLVKSGTTTVVNIESFPQLIDQVPDLRLRVWWCLEMIDFKRTQLANELIKEALDFIAAHPNVLGGFGLSPHAPYTASADLYRQAAHWARSHKMLLTTHLAESEEEDDMLRRGTGHMYDYFIRAGRDMSDCKRQGSAQMLFEYGVLGPNCLAVHANCLTPLDVKLLKQSGAHVVHCPKSHRFFNRGTPLLPAFWDQDINVCLGTDSFASNDSLNMFLEMQTLAHVFPRLSAEQLLQMATTNAAKALGQEQKLGRIEPGAWADLIAVPLDGAIADPYEAIVYTKKPVSFSMVGGKVIVG